ncbi:hypothetical protein [Massilia sp. BSC265]|uniref:hypothetical protein n=1 Tax=Massilia sp. BSC265 TaxID=1549812 RepID=UPI0004E8BFE9|nr:hypothetical protein [Massilia sp. BSC265]KFI09101.1 hypothetical protein JN27_00205 [Massilia sp. BSC265]
MQAVLQFPSKIFIQWGAIAQEIVPYLAQRGVKREEIRAVVERLRARWEQLDPAPSGQGTESETSDAPETAQVPGSLEEGAMYISRHWRSQPARTLIESAMADYQRHTRS